MTLFTCINCQVAFKEPELQRDHYKTDWHRYNLKRRIAELPPLTEEEFQFRSTQIKQENDIKSKGKSYTYCSVCKKSFASNQSFENHSRSKKHLELSVVKNVENPTDIAKLSVKNNKPVEKMQIPQCEPEDDCESIETASSGTEELDSDEWEEVISENNAILHNDCLFCTHHSASMTKNVKHMSIAHSFFIPYIEYLADLKGLLFYLGEKICQGYMCIWCNKKNCFVNIEAVRNHMIDKGHTKIPSDTESSLEYLDFYNFDVEGGDDDKSISESNNIEPPSKTEGDDMSMLLPSGDSISHRSLLRYIKQNPNRAKKYLPKLKETKIQRLISHYRGLGWSPTKKEEIKKKMMDIKCINLIQSRYETKLKVKSNKLQKHFRPQVDF